RNWRKLSAPDAFSLPKGRETLSWRSGFDQLVDDRIHQRLERSVDDVGRHPDRRPMIAGLVLAFDQDPGHGLRTAVEDAHAIIDEFQPGDEALTFAEILA